mmetsp:Transcript_54503/g.121970  ORF Transcript_54503/g.121970 Transcript_54503/m.121970 type:complete len:272 (-) Transcript_54503:555-1370(-)
MVVVQILAPVKEAGSQHAPNATEAVNGHRIHWIINLQLLQEHGGALVHESANQTDRKGAAALHVATSRSDGHQARQNAVAKSTHIVLPQDGVAQEEDADASCRSCQCGVHGHLRCQGTCGTVVHSQGGPRVEAIPTKPERESAQHHQRKVVALELLGILKATLARAKHNSASQCAHSTCQMHDSTAGKVHVTHRSHGSQPATAPRPSNNDGIDEAGHEECVHRVSGALYALSNAAAHNCGSGCAEGPLEEPAQHGALTSISSAINRIEHTA